MTKSLLVILLAVSIAGCEKSKVVQKVLNTVKEATMPKLEWPDAEAPDKTDPYWEYNQSFNQNGTQYHKIEVSPGKWQWTVDEEVMQGFAAREQRRGELYSALRTRILTEDEMNEAMAQGYSLTIPMANGGMSVSYNENEKRREFDDAVAQQFRLRLIAKQYSHPVQP